MIAQIGGVPIDKALPSVTVAGAGPAMARRWILRLPRRCWKRDKPDTDERVLFEVVGLPVTLRSEPQEPGNGVGSPADSCGSAGLSSRQVEQTGLG